MTNIFIDGQAGTTGLQIRERLLAREDVALMEIPESSRKDPEERRRYLNEADVVILCLPDDAAREAVGLISSNHVRVLDASTAHRVADGWIYGLPELDANQRENIRNAARVSNPGCYPTGFVLLTRPLVDAGIVPVDSHLSCHAISGYSGGGRRLIERYEARGAEHPDSLWHVRPYGLDLRHKHLPEMARYSGIDPAPVFSPMVGHFAQGMLTMVPLHTDTLGRAPPPKPSTRVSRRGTATSPASRCFRWGPKTRSTPDFSIRWPPTGRTESICSSTGTTPGSCSSRASTTSARERRVPRCRT